MKANDKQDELIEAIRDLTRVLLLQNESVVSKSEIIRRLYSYSMSPSRIALLLGMKPKDVTSALAKAKKAATNGK